MNDNSRCVWASGIGQKWICVIIKCWLLMFVVICSNNLVHLYMCDFVSFWHFWYLQRNWLTYSIDSDDYNACIIG